MLPFLNTVLGNLLQRLCDHSGERNQWKVSGQGAAGNRFTERMTALEGRLTEAQDHGADLIIVQVPAETSSSVNLQISQAERHCTIGSMMC